MFRNTRTAAPDGRNWNDVADVCASSREVFSFDWRCKYSGIFRGICVYGLPHPHTVSWVKAWEADLGDGSLMPSSLWVGIIVKLPAKTVGICRVSGDGITEMWNCTEEHFPVQDAWNSGDGYATLVRKTLHSAGSRSACVFSPDSTRMMPRKYTKADAESNMPRCRPSRPSFPLLDSHL